MKAFSGLLSYCSVKELQAPYQKTRGTMGKPLDLSEPQFIISKMAVMVTTIFLDYCED